MKPGNNFVEGLLFWLAGSILYPVWNTAKAATVGFLFTAVTIYGCDIELIYLCWKLYSVPG